MVKFRVRTGNVAEQLETSTLDDVNQWCRLYNTVSDIPVTETLTDTEMNGIGKTNNQTKTRKILNTYTI